MIGSPSARAATLAARLFRPSTLFGLIALALPGFATTAARAGEILYAGDYNGNQVVTFDGTTGSALAGNPFLTPGGESIAGLNNNIFTESGNVIYEYNLTTKALEGTINAGAFVLGMAVSQDGKSLYATETNSVVQYSLQSGNFGAVLASATTPDSWGVSVDPATGQVLVNNGWSAGAGGVQLFNANLTGGTTLVAAGDHGLTAGAGIIWNRSGTDFYAVNGGNYQPGSSTTFVNEYAANGTFVAKINLGNIVTTGATTFYNAFGAAINSDGNIFVSSQSANSVVEINASTDATSLFIGPNNGASQSIKTIFFSSQFVSVPEPSSIILIASAIPVVVALARSRRRARA